MYYTNVSYMISFQYNKGGKMKKEILLRIPDELNNKLEAKANDIGISRNALISHILWQEIEKKG